MSSEFTQDGAAPHQEDTMLGGAGDHGASVIDVTTETFMAEVIEASQDRLVLLDLWAPWCGPCKQLTPVLEKLAAQSDGAVRLAKMNIDEHPAVAQQLQVQSIPACVCL
jgi:putative thioredoxin